MQDVCRGKRVLIIVIISRCSRSVSCIYGNPYILSYTGQHHTPCVQGSAASPWRECMHACMVTSLYPGAPSRSHACRSWLLARRPLHVAMARCGTPVPLLAAAHEVDKVNVTLHDATLSFSLLLLVLAFCVWDCGWDSRYQAPHGLDITGSWRIVRMSLHACFLSGPRYCVVCICCFIFQASNCSCCSLAVIVHPRSCYPLAEVETGGMCRT